MKKWRVDYIARVREVWEVEAEDATTALDMADSGIGKKILAVHIGSEEYSWDAREIEDSDQEGTRTDT